MRKWFVITFIVLFVFFIIILLLGYMLQENKKESIALKTELDHARVTQQSKKNKNTKLTILNNEQEQESAKKRLAKVKAIITKGLTCVENDQCKAVALNFSNKSCTIAVNSIAFSQLNKERLTFDTTSNCKNHSQNSTLSCKLNTCQFIQ